MLGSKCTSNYCSQIRFAEPKAGQPRQITMKITAFFFLFFPKENLSNLQYVTKKQVPVTIQYLTLLSS